MGLKTPEVKQTAVKEVAYVHSIIIIIKVLCSLFKHHTEKVAEQSRCQDATQFHAVGDGENS